jgi:SAM-dependent methyltransferase
VERMTSGGVSRWTDQEFLRDDQYRTEENLRRRQSIYAFQQPAIDLPRVVLELVSTTGHESVVDVGCGNGRYLAELARRRHVGLVIGIDMSAGMLAVAGDNAPEARSVCGDACALPLRTGRADLVLAMHMLYHVPDTALAIHELRRVTAMSGKVVIGLNESDHLREVRAAFASAEQNLGLHLGTPGERLTLSKGQELMLAAFGSVERHDFVAELVLTELGPIERYVLSTISSRFVPEAQQADYVAQVLANLPLTENGELRIRTHSGCLICC